MRDPDYWALGALFFVAVACFVALVYVMAGGLA